MYTNNNIIYVLCMWFVLNDYKHAYAPIKIMSHLLPTWHRRGLDHFCDLIFCPSDIIRDLHVCNDPLIDLLKQV